MSSKQKDEENNGKHIPDSSKKKARGSKSVHSEKDDSTEDGWQPNKDKKSDKHK